MLPGKICYRKLLCLFVRFASFYGKRTVIEGLYQNNLKELFSNFVGLSVDGEEKKERQTRGGKANKLAKKKTAERKIILKRETRSKKKCVTIIKGLSTFSIDNKKAAKAFANKFSCGSSVTGDDEIVIQGDVADDLVDFLLEKYPDIDEDAIEDLT